MDYAVLFRRGIDQEHEEEFLVAQKYFPVVELRSKCPPNHTIIGRFSTLPFYKELCEDLNSINSKLINSHTEHTWISDFGYYYDLEEFTAETWDDHSFYLCKHEGPFVVKGRTNSRKGNWSTKMFAKNKRTAVEIAAELASDPLIGPQGVIYRRYIPLVTYEIGINEQPFTNEWRFFYYRNERLCYGYYWTQMSDPSKAEMTEKGLMFADKIAGIAKEHTNFFVLDIAEKAEGGWMLVEINEGAQAGLSLNDPEILYKNLKLTLCSS